MTSATVFTLDVQGFLLVRHRQRPWGLFCLSFAEVVLHPQAHPMLDLALQQVHWVLWEHFVPDWAQRVYLVAH